MARVAAFDTLIVAQHSAEALLAALVCAAGTTHRAAAPAG